MCCFAELTAIANRYIYTPFDNVKKLNDEKAEGLKDEVRALQKKAAYYRKLLQETEASLAEITSGGGGSIGDDKE